MKKLLLISQLLCILISAHVYAAKNTEVYEYEKVFRVGSAALSAKNYVKAFNYLNRSAKLGNKQAQYSIALMYISGQGTQKDFTRAYLWLNVASEAKEPTWRKLKSQIQNALSDQQREILQPEVNEYIKLYGTKTQDISCKLESSTGRHKRYMICNKRLDTGSLRL